MRGGKPGIQLDGALKSEDRLRVPIQDGQQKADFILQLGRLGSPLRGILERRERSRRISFRFELLRLSFQILDGLARPG
jgi:hypothetical protein